MRTYKQVKSIIVSKLQVLQQQSKYEKAELKYHKGRHLSAKMTTHNLTVSAINTLLLALKILKCRGKIDQDSIHNYQIVEAIGLIEYYKSYAPA
jgi:hypothetical protein